MDTPPTLEEKARHKARVAALGVITALAGAFTMASLHIAIRTYQSEADSTIFDFVMPAIFGFVFYRLVGSVYCKITGHLAPWSYEALFKRRPPAPPPQE